MGRSKEVVRCPNPVSDRRLEQWVDGLLRGDDRREIDDHIARCDDCRQRAEVVAGRRMAGF